MNLTSLLLLCLIYNVKALATRRKDWWRYTTIYEVYIWSFMDSDGDGVGDIKGITSKLDHFVDLGIETIWISPFFPTAKVDMGYDVVNYTAIDPMFGTMDDFEELVEKMNEKGLKLTVDFVINHSSDQHLWFKNSIDKIEPYTDYYVWRNAKGYDENKNPLPPNNWMSLFGGSAWTWNEKRKQFYYHPFSVNQPDLNLRNEALKSDLKDMIKFWFDKGVAGGRLDAAENYLEDLHFRDEVFKDANNKNPAWNDFSHIYTLNLWETYEFIHELRTFVDKRYATKNMEKILFAEIYFANLNQSMAYYGTTDHKMTHFPLNIGFVTMDKFQNPKSLDEKIKYWLNNMPAHGVANWMSENHDNSRTGNRLGPLFRDIMVTTMLTLPGVACIYYGQEIGMTDYKVRPDQIQDPQLHELDHIRDPERLPMQWDDSLNAGFSSNPKTWLPVNPNYFRTNVEYQKRTSTSRYNMYKTLSKLRKTKTLMYGDFQSYFISSWVYAFSRSSAGEPKYITILNLGTETEMIHLQHSISNLPAMVTVRAASKNAGYVPGDKLYTHPKYPQTFILRPMSALVVSTS